MRALDQLLTGQLQKHTEGTREHQIRFNRPTSKSTKVSEYQNIFYCQLFLHHFSKILLSRIEIVFIFPNPQPLHLHKAGIMIRVKIFIFQYFPNGRGPNEKTGQKNSPSGQNLPKFTRTSITITNKGELSYSRGFN